MKTWFKNTLKGKKLLVVTVLAFLALGVLGWLYAPPNPSEQKTEVITHSTDTPDETKPASSYEWRGEPDDPKYIRLPTIQTEGYIQNVGVDQNKQVAVPNNIHMAGWFSDSVRLGKMGLSIIDGHVDGRQEAGIFQHLADLKANDEYSIEMGNGSLKRYRVKNLATLDTQEAANTLFSQNLDIKSQLNLVTCGGSFDQQSRQYDKRVIVISEFIN